MPAYTAVHTPNAPPPLPVYSQAIICNGMVYCSGQVGVDPATKQMLEGGVEERTKQCLTNLSQVLLAAGSSMANVVKVAVFLTSMDDFAAVNREYAKWFGDVKPEKGEKKESGPLGGVGGGLRCYKRKRYVRGGNHFCDDFWIGTRANEKVGGLDPKLASAFNIGAGGDGVDACLLGVGDGNGYCKRREGKVGYDCVWMRRE
ncbi:MAG: hypothetical protein Q9163_001371 [Psora crenata]